MKVELFGLDYSFAVVFHYTASFASPMLISVSSH